MKTKTNKAMEGRLIIDNKDLKDVDFHDRGMALNKQSEKNTLDKVEKLLPILEAEQVVQIKDPVIREKNIQVLLKKYADTPNLKRIQDILKKLE